MKNYETIDYSCTDFNINRDGILNECFEVPIEMERWFYRIISSESGNLIKINTDVGFLYRSDEVHMGQPEYSPGYEYSRKHGSRTEEDVFQLLEDVAAEMRKVHPYQIFLDRKSGENDCHEFGLFFPYGMELKDISWTIKYYEDTRDKLEKERWNSFFDFFEKDQTIITQDMIDSDLPF